MMPSMLLVFCNRTSAAPHATSHSGSVLRAVLLLLFFLGGNCSGLWTDSRCNLLLAQWLPRLAEPSATQQHSASRAAPAQGQKHQYLKPLDVKLLVKINTLHLLPFVLLYSHV